MHRAKGDRLVLELSATTMQCVIVAFIYVDKSCADPESFARGGPILTTLFLVDERINIPL